MKKTNILYWTFTSLFAFFMAGSAIPDIFSSPVALEGFKRMSMPSYLTPFLGIAKALGVIALFIPGYPRIREWAYAGLFFDLLGATWCVYNSAERGSSIFFMALPIAAGVLSYVYYHRRLAYRNTTETIIPVNIALQ